MCACKAAIYLSILYEWNEYRFCTIFDVWLIQKAKANIIQTNKISNTDAFILDRKPKMFKVTNFKTFAVNATTTYKK